MILRLATHLNRRPSAATAAPNLERARVPWLLVMVGGVAFANIAAVLLTLAGQ